MTTQTKPDKFMKRLIKLTNPRQQTTNQGDKVRGSNNEVVDKPLSPSPADTLISKAKVMKILNREISEESFAVKKKIDRMPWTIVDELKFLKKELEKM